MPDWQTSDLHPKHSEGMSGVFVTGLLAKQCLARYSFVDPDTSWLTDKLLHNTLTYTPNIPLQTDNKSEICQSFARIRCQGVLGLDRTSDIKHPDKTFGFVKSVKRRC